MIRRPLRPTFAPGDEKLLLDALRNARDLALKFGSAEKFGSRRHQRCDALKESIDALAEELTGDRTLFHAKPHGHP